MDLTPNKSSNNQNGGPLKTTTWGALIAIALLMGLLGTTSYVLHPFGSPQVVQTAGNTGLGQNGGVPSVAQHSYNTHSSKFGLNNAPAFQQPIGVQANGPVSAGVPLAVIVGVAEQHGNSSGAKAAQATQQDPLSGGLTSGTANPQALIAAKIAPDLREVDPAKPVDVIVQFKRATGTSGPQR